MNAPKREFEVQTGIGMGGGGVLGSESCRVPMVGTCCCSLALSICIEVRARGVHGDVRLPGRDVSGLLEAPYANTGLCSRT